MDENEQRVPDSKIAEARALWEISLVYLALGAASRALLSSGSPAEIAASGYRAGQLLAWAYYRLLRAVWTGYTLDGRGEAGEYTSLYDLYADFETLAFRLIPESRHPDTRRRMALAAKDLEEATEGIVPVPDEEALPEDRFEAGRDYAEAAEGFSPEETEDYAPDEVSDSEWSRERDILIERLEELESLEKERRESASKALKELEEQLRKAQEAERAREREAIKKASSRTTPAATRKESAAQRRSLARAQRAAAIMRGAQAGARDDLNSLVKADPRAVGWVRVPHHPTPCGWCLMLASRGLIYYKSAASARSAWHENCHCTAEPVFSREHYMSSPLFAKNRALHMMWRDHGFGKGKRGERDFRNYFLSQYRAGKHINQVIADNAEAHT